MFLNLLRQVQEEALSREVAKRKLPNEVRDEKWPLTVTPICGVSTPLKFSRSNFLKCCLERNGAQAPRQPCSELFFTRVSVKRLILNDHKLHPTN